MKTTLVAELDLEALEWEPSLAGGQLALLAFVFVSCIGLSVLVTYVLEEVRHDPGRHRDDEEPRSR